MNRSASRIASGVISVLLVLGGAGIAQADDAGTGASTGAVTVVTTTGPADQAPVTINPLTNDWG
ncbi:hypothetical protein ACIQWR_39475 [Streptomyces sp. NPDC098789]|uniref:hypothetical protein n=1 Tax=Streptomyces sp. NPDC098789 TaxID=3366098 RepID=UPI00382F630A